MPDEIEIEYVLTAQNPLRRWRPAVESFADLMEVKLQVHDGGKDGWAGRPTGWLMSRMVDEIIEMMNEMEPEGQSIMHYFIALHMLRLASAELAACDLVLSNESTPEKLGFEAADVANFAMMIASNCGSLE